jgi:hypothetical protein
MTLSYLCLLKLPEIMFLLLLGIFLTALLIIDSFRSDPIQKSLALGLKAESDHYKGRAGG